MSQADTEKALVNQLIAQLAPIEILYENENKIPAGNEFLSSFFIPASNDPIDKTSSCTQDEGIFQVTVATSINSYNNRSLEIVDQVLQAFGINSELTYNNQKVSITETSVNAGRQVDGFFKRDVSIDYLTFS